MSNIILFSCPGCRARIKAPFNMRGQKRACPGCGQRFVVKSPPPEDQGPILVPNERLEQMAQSQP